MKQRTLGAVDIQWRDSWPSAHVNFTLNTIAINHCRGTLVSINLFAAAKADPTNT